MQSINLFPRFAQCPSLFIDRGRHLNILLRLSAITAARSHQISPLQSSFRTMLTSPQRAIRSDLTVLPVDKWGWVIYRCSYAAANEAIWARFRSHVETYSREEIAASDAPEIADRLEWTWVEDSTLDFASPAALREKFRAWAAKEVERQPGDYSPEVIPRYNFFIVVDDEAMRSLDEPDDLGMPWPRNAFVKFVDADWEPSSPDDAEQEDEFGGSEAFEPIGGCTENDIGWMRIAPHMVNTDFYDDWCGDLNLWTVFYKRPPKILER
jgi:hypothetical protein